MEKLLNFCKKYYPAILMSIYMLFFNIWFNHLENTITTNYFVIQILPDEYIPFCEVFIIPYLLWYIYVAGIVVYLFFKNRTDYAKCCFFLAIGMTIFLIISALWPNGHNLRPATMPRDNIFTQMITILYQMDTSTNICPSIHVYNSIGAHLAISKCSSLRKYKILQTASLLLCLSIIISTVMIKQHSTFDIIAAFVLASVVYQFVYVIPWNTLLLPNRKRKFS